MAGLVRKLFACSTWKKVFRCLLPIAAIVGVLVALGFSFPDLVANMFSHPPPAKCAALPPAGPGNSGEKARTVTATLEEGQREEIDFGRSITARTVTFYLDLNAAPVGPASFTTRTNAFVRSDDAPLSPAEIHAKAERVGTTLLVSVCFTRTGSTQTNLGDPGSYLGSVTVDDGRLTTPVTIPMTVTMQYTNGVFLLWLLLGAIVPGAWCIWVIRKKRGNGSRAFSTDFFNWAFSIDGVIAIVVGSVTAFSVYMAVYLRDPTWGSSALQPLTLYGSMFSAFVTTSGLASLTSAKGTSGPLGDDQQENEDHPA